eukprot:1923783-Prymnesium_polylepis.1
MAVWRNAEPWDREPRGAPRSDGVGDDFDLDESSSGGRHGHACGESRRASTPARRSRSMGVKCSSMPNVCALALVVTA